MLVHTDGMGDKGTRRFQYSLTTLLGVMLLVGMTITLYGWIDPIYRNDDSYWRVQSFWNYPTWRKPLSWIVWKVAMSPLLFAAACLPAYLDQPKRGFMWAVGLFPIALLATVLIDARVRHYIVYPLFQGTPVYESYVSFYLIPHVFNSAAVALCLLTAATAMHWLGYRIRPLRLLSPR